MFTEYLILLDLNKKFYQVKIRGRDCIKNVELELISPVHNIGVFNWPLKTIATHDRHFAKNVVGHFYKIASLSLTDNHE